MAKILIAEDERDIRELIEFTLTALASHQVFKAADGVEAVEMATRVLPDLIMMDVRMPRMTGYEACKILKQNDALKNVPIVFLSAKGQETEIDTGLDVGAYDYILKPFAPYELANRVAEILNRFEKNFKATAVTTPSTPATPPIPATPPVGVGVPAATVPATGASGTPGTDTKETNLSANVETKDADPPTVTDAKQANPPTST
jgi:two-component system alkaline phosphatase synthesis response regulator PhoP